MAIVEHELVIGGDGYWASCALCEGTGLVIDNRREESIDCPSCDGMGMVYFEDSDEWDDEEEDAEG